MSLKHVMSPARPPAAEAPPSAGTSPCGTTTAAALVVALFYLLCLLALLLLGTLLFGEVIVMLGLVRFGMSGIMTAPANAVACLVGLICQSLGLKRGPEYQMPLSREEAPELHCLIERVAARIGVPPPQRTVLEMTATAWVDLRGHRRGQGRAKLGIGYDLLILLTADEIEAVIAHEMAHAKLVERGLFRWMANGIHRMGQLSQGLHPLISEARASKQRFWTARILAHCVKSLARLERRLFAASSRQDEFAADRLAAEVCGATALREALLRIAVASPRSAALGPRERLIQSQRGESFSAWLRAELTPPITEHAEWEARALREDRRDEFSTHPALADRLAALERAPGPAEDDRPASALLRDADALADRLLTTLENVAQAEERRHSDQLRRDVRRQAQSQHLTGPQVVGVILGTVGIVGILVTGIALCDAPRDWAACLGWLVGSLSMTGLGVRLFRGSSPREREPLPVPPFHLWREAMEPAARGGMTPTRLDALTVELRDQLPREVRGRRATARHWGEVGYRALERCDYAQALAASRLCLWKDRHALPGLLTRAVTLTYFGSAAEAGEFLSTANHRYGLGPSVAWAIGWMCGIQGDWARAEPYLLEAVRHRDTGASLWALLAYAQWQQEKLREAEHNFRQAIRLEPREPEFRRALTRLLLASGRPKDASRELEWLEVEDPTAKMVRRYRLHTDLLLGREEAAARHAGEIEASHPGSVTLLRLGQVYLDARRHETARGFFERVLTDAFYPRAHLSLAQIAYERRELDATRSHLLAALDLTRPLGPEAEGPLAVLEDACHGLLALEEPIRGLSAWSATLEVVATGLGTRQLTLFVHACTREHAQQHVERLLRAMLPERRDADGGIRWDTAEPLGEQFPPGIYGHQLG